MSRRWPVILASFAVAMSPVMAQDEDVRPEATTLAEAGSSCTTSDSHTTLDDDVDGSGTDWCTADGCAANPTPDTQWRMNLGTPSSNPSTTTNAQEFAARVRTCQSGGTNATCRLDLYCNGSLVESGGEQAVSNATAEIITETFTFNTGSCASDGSDAQVELFCTASGGTPSNRRTAEAEAVEWRVTWSTASATPMRRRINF